MPSSAPSTGMILATTIISLHATSENIYAILTPEVRTLVNTNFYFLIGENFPLHGLPKDYTRDQFFQQVRNFAIRVAPHSNPTSEDLTQYENLLDSLRILLLAYNRILKYVLDKTTENHQKVFDSIREFAKDFRDNSGILPIKSDITPV